MMRGPPKVHSLKGKLFKQILLFRCRSTSSFRSSLYVSLSYTPQNKWVCILSSTFLFYDKEEEEEEEEEARGDVL